MRPDPDDDALSWGDETDPTHIDARADVREPADGDVTRASTASSAMLVAYGVFGGVYLLYVVGWLIAVQRDTYVQASLLAEIMYQLGEFLAIASPAVWLGAVLLLTRESRAVTRIASLLAGLVLVAPWPFILGGSA